MSSQKKKFNRAAIQEVDIPRLCDSLIKWVPEKGGMQQITSKFSLYLLSQLMYGVVVVLERQTFFLEVDIRAARIAAENLYINVNENFDDKVDTKEVKKGLKRKLKDTNFDLDIRNLPPTEMDSLDAVGCALYNQITLQDPVPRQALPFSLDDDLPIISREEQAEWEKQDALYQSMMVVERHSSNGSEERQAKIEDHHPSPKPFTLLEQQFEMPPLDPFSINEDLREPFDLTVQPTAQKEQILAIDEPRTPEQRKRPADILQLDEQITTPATIKRRRPVVKMRDDATIKEGFTDYSSTLRPLRDLLVKPATVDDADELLKPYPTWMRRPFNKELRELYKPIKLQKMTYKEAAEVNPNSPLSRGPESKLWRYEGSSEEHSLNRELMPLDEDLRLAGVGFVHPTPERIKSHVEEEEMPMMPPMADFEEIGAHGRTWESDLEQARRQSSSLAPLGASGRRSPVLEEGPHIGSSHLWEEMGHTLLSEAVSFKEATKKTILSALSESPDGDMVFNSLFSPRNTTRKQAATAFSCLLDLIKDKHVTAHQQKSYAPIIVRASEVLGEI